MSAFRAANSSGDSGGSSWYRWLTVSACRFFAVTMGVAHQTGDRPVAADDTRPVCARCSVPESSA